MKQLSRLLLALAIMVSAGCSTVSSSLPLQFRDADTGLVLSLQASWKGFSILHEKPAWVPADLKAIVIRHPRWSTKEPYVDIKIYVYTLEQWAAHEQRGDFGIGAGGVEGELYRNAHYVFAEYSRDINFGYAPEDPGFEKGGDEAESILQNLRDQHPEAAGRRH